jgi:hypothetical protein
MGEYEPHDSRLITLKDERAPGEPPRTGPRESETRQQQQGETELDEDQRGDDAEQVPDAEALREEAMERDAEELGDRDD